MTRGRPKSYTERQRYLLRVLFLYGCSPAEIAKFMGMYDCQMTPAMASGQVAALGYRKRDMPRAVRQRLLDELKANRLDKQGRLTPLPDWFFEAR